MSKLILGTAGLGGLPYGLGKKRVQKDEAIALIRRAHECGIRAFDTAPVYGEAESWLGEALIGRQASIFTKTNGDIEASFTSMERLRSTSVTFLWHNWRGAPLPHWVRGVTVYDADPHPKLLPGNVEYVQKDWNLLRQSDPPTGGEFAAQKPRFIARSVFLQGVLTEHGEAPSVLKAAVHRARRAASLMGVDLTTLALGAALDNPAIHYVLIGPTTIDELETCIEIASESKPLRARHIVPLLHENSNATDPRTW